MEEVGVRGRAYSELKGWSRIYAVVDHKVFHSLLLIRIHTRVRLPSYRNRKKKETNSSCSNSDSSDSSRQFDSKKKSRV